MPDAQQALPETMLQFGGGNFLRGFADLIIDEANDAGQQVGRVVVVQSTASNRADAINAQRGIYHVAVRGLWQGEAVDQTEQVTCISRALTAATQWNDILAVACSPQLKYVLSNTTEAGIALDEADAAQQLAPPVSFPARLAALLAARFAAGQAGLIIIPCELVEQNATKLRELVLRQARQWKLGENLCQWLEQQCVWLDTLVDRIVSGRPARHALLGQDQLLIAAEPFALWAIQEDSRAPFLQHPAVQRTADVQRFWLRKVRILNGAHTALVCKALPMGLVTVRQAVENPDVSAWLRHLLFDEIVPTVEDRVDQAAAFANSVLERFANPFLEHKLAAITLHHQQKLAIRLVTTRDEFVAKFGRRPALLDEAIAAGAGIKDISVAA